MQHDFKKIPQVSSEASAVSMQGFKASISIYTDPEINFYFLSMPFQEVFSIIL